MTKSYWIDKNEVEDFKDIIKEIGQVVDLSVEQAGSGTTSKEPDEVEEAFNMVEVHIDEVNVLIITFWDGEYEKFVRVLFIRFLFEWS